MKTAAPSRVKIREIARGLPLAGAIRLWKTGSREPPKVPDFQGFSAVFRPEA